MTAPDIPSSQPVESEQGALFPSLAALLMLTYSVGSGSGSFESYIY